MNPASRLAQIKPSPIRVLSEGAPPDAIPLGLGEPTWELPKAARKALGREKGTCAYGPNAGLEDLRRAIGAWHRADASETLVTSGSQGALFSLFMAWLEPGDEVLVPNPGFPAYPALAHMAGAQPVMYDLCRENHFRLDAQALLSTLDAHPKARIVILNHPCNPTGGGASTDELRRVARGCESRDVLLISDEVYRDLHFGNHPPSLRDVGSSGVVLGSMSKGWAAPGLRVGWAVGDAKWLAPARMVHSYAVTAASSTAQRAALALLEDSEDILAQGRKEIAVRWEALAAAIQEHFGQTPEPPDGAFYHWLPLPAPAHADPLGFCLRLRDEAKVVLVPGTAFGPGGQAFARLSFAAQPEQLAEGIRRIAPFWRNA